SSFPSMHRSTPSSLPDPSLLPPPGGFTEAPKVLDLSNKPGEPAFQLKLEPSDDIELTWMKGEESHVNMKITNTTPYHQSYKVR
ncbi:hypothetical protein PENTCL1PPCAC_2576, partial [Pristionchus entomophagus]